MPERILVVGAGGREHAIAWKIKNHDAQNRELFFAPGNGGTQSLGRNIDIDQNDVDRLTAFAKDNNIGFTVVGPEKPLAAGIVNAFNREGFPIFGHTQEAAKLESDKGDAVLFMRRHNIPHPDSEIFTDPKAAEAFIHAWSLQDLPVIKASGLADGKGVDLPDSKEEAISSIRRMMIDRRFGSAGEKIIIQERLKGKEASIIGFVANGKIGLLVPAQDYKRIGEGDTGPNTGGMGGYAPNDYITPEIMHEIQTKILKPTIDGMIGEGRDLGGGLYVGVMLTETGVKVIEYNLRLGDPETQIQLRLLNSDLLHIMQAVVNGTLREEDVRSGKGFAVANVIASKGYPGNPEIRKTIRGLDLPMPKGIVIFHGGTKMQEGILKTSGGRVLTVTGIGETKKETRENNLGFLDERNEFINGQQVRRDIAK